MFSLKHLATGRPDGVAAGDGPPACVLLLTLFRLARAAETGRRRVCYCLLLTLFRLARAAATVHHEAVHCSDIFWH